MCAQLLAWPVHFFDFLGFSHSYAHPRWSFLHFCPQESTILKPLSVQRALQSNDHDRNDVGVTASLVDDAGYGTTEPPATAAARDLAPREAFFEPFRQRLAAIHRHHQPAR